MGTSGQFHCSTMGSATQVGSAVAINDVRTNTHMLYYFVPGSSGDVKIVTCNVSCLQTEAGEKEDITNKDNWNKENLSGLITDSNDANFQSNYGTASVKLGNRLYFFWVDTHNKGLLYAAYYDYVQNQYSPCAYLVIDGDNKSLSLSSDLSAIVSPDEGSIIVQFLISSQLGMLSLNPEQIDEKHKSWNGSLYELSPSTYGVTIDSSYYGISSSCFSQGSQGNFMMVSFYSSKEHDVKFLLYPIKMNGKAKEAPFSIGGFSCRRGFTIIRDPAGRLYGVQCSDHNDNDPNDTDKNLYYRTFSTYADITDNSNWSSESLLNGTSHESSICPTLVFIEGRTATGQDFHGYNNCTEIEQYSMALYANSNNDLEVQVAPYGWSIIIPEYETLKPIPTETPLQVINMIMDTFPFPNENLGTSVAPNNPIITYDYGVTSASNFATTVSIDTLYGIKGAITTTNGIGPAVETEYKTGPQQSTSDSRETKVVNSYAVSTTPTMENQSLVIGKHGECHGITPPDIIQGAAIFLDIHQTPLSGVSAPLFNSLTAAIGTSSPISEQFTTYCYTPGNIESYLENNINQTMKDKYNGLSLSQQGDLSPDYAIDYINKIIIPNAQDLDGKGKNCLRFSIGASGMTTEGFESISRTMENAGWTYAGTAYAGVGTGIQFNIFGVGEGINTSLMVGYDCTSIIGGSEVTETTWGLYFDPQIPQEVPGAKEYSVAMYLCKPNNLWARELQYFGGSDISGKNIDFANITPSKIMFVVTNIS